MTLFIDQQKIYNLNNDDKKELQSIDLQHESIIGNLSLFVATPEQVEKDVADSTKLVRPVTPLQDEIQSVPDSLESLRESIRRRIQPDDSKDISCDQQMELAGVIMAEVNACWRDLKQQIDYPLFNVEENQQLNRRIVLHVVAASIELFHYYCRKAEGLVKKKVFSLEANFDRLKVEVALEARKLLNVLIIRRYITEDIKARKELEVAKHFLNEEQAIYPDLDDKESVKLSEKSGEKVHPLSLKSVLMKNAPHAPDMRHVHKTGKELVKELNTSMPILSLEKLVPLMENIPDHTFFEDESRLVSSQPLKHDKDYLLQDSETLSMHSDFEAKYGLFRCDSQPELRGDACLAHEIELDLSAVIPKHKEVDEKLLTFVKPDESLDKYDKNFSNLSDSLLQSDLQKLAQPLDPFTKTNTGNEDEDLPPLIQASEKIKKESDRLQKLKAKIIELDNKARQQMNEDIFIPAEPSHPQPTVISRKLNQMSVRLSDVRPKERQCMSRITQKMFDPLWNDITGDIDDEIVKELDKGLYKGEEIRNVYNEIMKTVDQSHRNFTSDPIIEPCADELTLTAMLASSSLHRPKKERVVNPKINNSNKQPPWAPGNNPKEWAKPNIFAPGDKKGAVNLANVVDNIITKEITQEADVFRQKAASKQETAPRPASRAPNSRYILSSEDFVRHVREMPKAVQERLIRSYSSWLSTWKADVDSEDYMKFLSTQETDFLGLVFHLYDSEDDEDEAILEKKKLDQARKEKERQRNEKLQQLLEEKTTFVSGYWNPQCVFMGGLGKNPDLLESETNQFDEKTQKEQTKVGLSKEDRPRILFKTRYDEGQSPLQTKQKSEVVEKSTTVYVKPDSQERLESLWNDLKFPDSLRVDMAIKYSNSIDLDDILDCWEESSGSVLAREKVIVELEQFERMASDPNRFFVKGHRGSSLARFEEGRIREELHTKLNNFEVEVKKHVNRLQCEFQDVLTYRGRPYLDKMKWDKVEMLYWLQEERRQTKLTLLKSSTVCDQRPRSPAVLPPLFEHPKVT